MSDAHIVKEILSGKTVGYESLVTQYFAVVRSICCSYEYNPESCEDLIQDTFIEGYMKLNRLRDGNRFGPWIAQIARNKCKAWIRKQSRQREVHAQLAVESISHGENTVLSELSKQEHRDWIHRSIQSLPVKTREAMLLFYVEGYSIEDAARCLGIRSSALKKRLQYGRELVGEQLCQDIRNDDSREDQQRQTKGIIAALPVASAPWLAVGSASAASGVATIVAWWKIPVVISVLLLGVLSFPLFVSPDVDELVIGPKQGEEVSVVSIDIAAEVASIVEVASNGDTKVGNLTVRTAFYVMNMSEDGSGSSGEGPPVANISMRATPSIQNPKLKEFLKKQNFTEYEIQVYMDQYKGRDYIMNHYTMEELSEVGQGLQGKMAGIDDDTMPRPYIHHKDKAIVGKSNANGVCVFKGLPAGIYWVEALWPGLNNPYENFAIASIEAQEETESLVIVRDCPVRGVVVDRETGELLKNVRVNLGGEMNKIGGFGHATSNEKGEFEFTHVVGYGTYELTLEHELYSSPIVKGVREIGVKSEVKIEAFKVKLGQVYGYVYKADGAPAARIDIYRKQIGGSGVVVGTTDENGRYDLSHDGGVVSLMVNGKQFAQSEWVELKLSLEESKQQDFVLPPATNIYFTIKGPRGEVPVNIDKEFFLKSGNGGSGNVLYKQKNGQYVLENLMVGEYDLWMYIKGYESELLLFSIDEDLQEKTIDVHLVPATFIFTLSFEDKNDNKVNSAAIWMKDMNHPEGSWENGYNLGATWVDEGKNVVLDNLWPGTFLIRDSGEEHIITIPKTKEFTVIREKAKRATTTSSQPKQEDSYYLHKKNLQLYIEDQPDKILSSGFTSSFVILPTGKIEKMDNLYSVKKGTYTVYGIKPGYTAGSTKLTVKDTAPSGNFSIPIGKAGSIYGQVTNKQGEVQANKQLYVLPAEVWENREEITNKHELSDFGKALAQELRTNSDGGFDLEFLPKGNFYVIAAHGYSAFRSKYMVETQWAGPFAIEPETQTGPVNLVLPERK